MRELLITENEAGQRLDKLLGKYLNSAPKSFIYKMLRKKNITLNEKKTDGSEKLSAGDRIKLYLSEETIEKFSEKNFKKTDYRLDIIYEDKHVLIVNKPAGLLSQKALADDVSINEQILSYLLESGELNEASLRTFRPSVCNRLDRNTSGILVAGKTLLALQEISRLFKERTIHKIYQCIVGGKVESPRKIGGYLRKDHKTNKVEILTEKSENSYLIQTEYEPVSFNQKKPNFTILKIKLITGKSHQIRAHLSSIGHPVIGDKKYGNEAINDYIAGKYQIRHQLLHSHELIFPELNGQLEYLSGRSFFAPLPVEFKKVTEGEF